MEVWVGWEYRAFEAALNRMETFGLYPLIKTNHESNDTMYEKLCEKTDFRNEIGLFLQPDRLKQLLEQYFQHFNQQPKNIDAYSRFLTKQLCFGHDWVEQEHHTDGIWSCEHKEDQRKPIPYLKPLKQGLRTYLLKEYFSWYLGSGHYSVSEDLFKLCLQYGIANRRSLPSISDILSDFDKVWTVMQINEAFFGEFIEDEQTVLQRYKFDSETY